MNGLLKYSVLVGLAIFGIGSCVSLNQPDTHFVVVEKIMPHNLERGPYIIVCHGDKSGREYRFALPAEDFEIVRINHRLLPSTVEQWSRGKRRRLGANPIFLNDFLNADRRAISFLRRTRKTSEKVLIFAQNTGAGPNPNPSVKNLYQTCLVHPAALALGLK